MRFFERVKNLKNKATQRKASAEEKRAHVQRVAQKVKQARGMERPPLSYPITNLHIQRRGTRVIKAAAVSMQGFPQENDSQHTFQPRLGGRHDFLFSVLDGHNGATASNSLKGLIEGKFAGLKMTNENITKALLWFDQQYNNKTMFRDGTTCCMVYGQPWNATTDDKIQNLELFLSAHDQSEKKNPLVDDTFEDPTRKPGMPDDFDLFSRKKVKVIDPLASFPDDFVLKLLTINVGNSKAMLIRPNGNWIGITEDHTCNNRKERNRILKAGGVIVEGKINGRHPVTRSIGDKLYKKLDGVPLLDQMVVPLPDFEEHIMLPGDLLLLSCDGLFKGQNMDFSTIAGLVADSVKTRGRDFDPAGVLRDLFEVSLEQGSRENHTAILLHFANGLQYVTPPLLEQEMIPGPLPKMTGIDKESATAPRFRYVKSYVGDLMRNGYTLDDVHEYHQAHKDFEINIGDEDIRPIVFKGDIGKQIAEEEIKRQLAENDIDEYLLNDTKFQYDDDLPQEDGKDPRETFIAQQAEKEIRKHGNKTEDRFTGKAHEEFLRQHQFQFKPDEGSKDNTRQREEDLKDPFDRLMDKYKDAPGINTQEFAHKAPHLTEYPPQDPKTRGFFQIMRDNVLGKKH